MASPTDSLPTGPTSGNTAPAPAPSGSPTGDHGQSIFNSPATNRATTGALNGGLSRENYGGSNTLGDRAQSALNGSGAAGGNMKASDGGRSSGGIGAPARGQAAKYKAQAGKDFGNAKAYRQNRREAAAHGVKLAAYSSLRKKSSSGPKPS